MKSDTRLQLRTGDKIIAILAGTNEGYSYQPGEIGIVRWPDRNEPPVVWIGHIFLGCVDLVKWERLVKCVGCAKEDAEESGLIAKQDDGRYRCGACQVESLRVRGEIRQRLNEAKREANAAKRRNRSHNPPPHARFD